MKHHLSLLVAATLTHLAVACTTDTDTDTDSQTSSEATETETESGETETESGDTAESGDTDESGDTAETGESAVACEDRDQADCFGLVDAEDESGASCRWTTLIPLTDAGNSCAMGAGVGRCMPVSPVIGGCGGAPQLECTVGDTTEYGTGAVVELDGQVYLLEGSFDCWPPSPMTTCDGPDTELGCECACDLILGG